MPFKWVPPEVFMQYRGVKVYYTYNDDSIYDPSEYWYGFDKEEDRENTTFDIRALGRAYRIEDFDPHNTKEVKRLIRESMKAGHLLNCMPPDIAEDYYERFGPFAYEVKE